MLEIKNLVVQIEDKRILNGLNLTVNKGEVAAIMGPNGSGKSTLSYVIAGKEDYEVLDGEILLDGQNILEMAPDERAAAGLFLAFQYPLEIPGVASMTFLKAAINAQRKARGESRADDARFHQARQRRRRQARDPQGHAQARSQCRLLRRREEAHGNPADGAAASRASAFSTRRIPASTSMRLRIVSEGVNALRSPDRVVPRHHPLSAPPELHRAGHACT